MNYKEKKDRITILLIGHKSSKVSGSALSFSRLHDNLNLDKRINLLFINTSRRNEYVNSFFINLIIGIKTIYQFCKIIKHVDICSFQSSEKAFIRVAPLIVLISRLFHKPVILRLFGGGSEIQNEIHSNIFFKHIFFQTKKSSIIFLQTKYLIKYFKQLGFKNLAWLPTSRICHKNNISSDLQYGECKNFVFFGRVIKEKGIITILDSIEWLNNGVKIDIWGSINKSITRNFINSHGNGIVKYKGEILHKKVPEKLAEYDALVLPTYYKGEGYPGIIIESYCQGLPVISTKWLSIPEIVDENTGILISIDSPKELANAINKMSDNIEYYRILRHGAIKKAKLFSEYYWYNYFVKRCYDTVYN